MNFTVDLNKSVKTYRWHSFYLNSKHFSQRVSLETCAPTILRSLPLTKETFLSAFFHDPVGLGCFRIFFVRNKNRGIVAEVLLHVYSTYIYTHVFLKRPGLVSRDGTQVSNSTFSPGWFTKSANVASERVYELSRR